MGGDGGGACDLSSSVARSETHQNDSRAGSISAIDDALARYGKK